MKKIILTVLSICSLSTFAQTEEVVVEETTTMDEVMENITINGSIDTYFRTNLGNPNYDADGVAGGPGYVPGTSFANQPGFALGMANVILGYEGEKVGFVADLAYGQRAQDAGVNDYINQMYAYWNVSEKVTLTMGKFNTFLGYEVISPAGNFNYSTSYLFSNGPFSHNGIKADIALSEDFSLMLAVMNDTDDTAFNSNNGAYAGGLQLGYKGQFFNVIYTDTSVITLDYTGGFDATEEFYIGINAAYKNDGDVESAALFTTDRGYYGAALYPQYSFSDSFDLGLRAEYFVFDSNIDNVDNGDVFAATLTGRYKVGNLTIIPELRLDSASEEIFVTDNPTSTSPIETGKGLSSFVLGAVYAF